MTQNDMYMPPELQDLILSFLPEQYQRYYKKNVYESYYTDLYGSLTFGNKKMIKFLETEQRPLLLRSLFLNAPNIKWSFCGTFLSDDVMAWKIALKKSNGKIDVWFGDDDLKCPSQSFLKALMTFPVKVQKQFKTYLFNEKTWATWFPYLAPEIFVDITPRYQNFYEYIPFELIEKTFKKYDSWKYIYIAHLLFAKKEIPESLLDNAKEIFDYPLDRHSCFMKNCTNSSLVKIGAIKLPHKVPGSSISEKDKRDILIRRIPKILDMDIKMVIKLYKNIYKYFRDPAQLEPVLFMCRTSIKKIRNTQVPTLETTISQIHQQTYQHSLHSS